MRYPPTMPALTILSAQYLRVAALASHILVVLLALGSVLAVLRLDDQLEPRELLDRQIGALCALKDLPT
jgi:hypothetical protein